MSVQFEANETGRMYAERVYADATATLTRAVEIVSPENPQANALEVFPAPGEVRNEDPGLNLTHESAEKLREVAAEFGFDRRTDLSPTMLGLSEAWMIIEGGQPHKIVAEAGLAVANGSKPRGIIFSASPYRQVSSDAEKASSFRQFNTEVATEYEAAENAARQLPNFVPLAKEIVLPFAYDINNKHAVSHKPSGQFTQIGLVNGAPVIMMRVDREDYTDSDGKSKFRNQPSPADVIGLVAAITVSQPESPIAFITSSTYQASRTIDAARASLRTGRAVGVPTYGTERLAEINGAGVTPPRLLAQLPGELHVTAKQLALLEQDLGHSAD